MLKKLLLPTIGSAIVGAMWIWLAVAAAHAAPMLSISVFDDGIQVGSTVMSATGAIFFAGSDVNFSDIQVSGEGAPVLLNPELSTTTLQATASSVLSGSHTLEVDIEQTGLDPFSGDLFLSGTYNELIGVPGGATLTAQGNGVTVDSRSLSGVVDDFGPVDVSVLNLTADATIYAMTFNGANQSTAGSYQVLLSSDVPEPASMAILGSALIGFGVLRRKRRA